MDRQLASVSRQTNPSRIELGRSLAMENGVHMSSLLSPSGFNTNFPLPIQDRAVRNPSLHPSRLLPFQTPLTSLPYPTNMHRFNPYSYPIRNQAALTPTPPTLRPFTPIHPTPSPLQNHATGTAKPRIAYPSRVLQTPERPTRIFTCSICYKIFPSQQSLAGHRAFHSKLFEKERLGKERLGNSSAPTVANASNEKMKDKEVKEKDSVEVIVIEDSSEDVETKKKRRGRDLELKKTDQGGYASDESVSSKIKRGKGEKVGLDLSLKL
ncbi:hypothetical protein AAC387_Pa03g4030 [Persea americana]